MSALSVLKTQSNSFFPSVGVFWSLKEALKIVDDSGHAAGEPHYIALSADLYLLACRGHTPPTSLVAFRPAARLTLTTPPDDDPSEPHVAALIHPLANLPLAVAVSGSLFLPGKPLSRSRLTKVVLLFPTIHSYHAALQTLRAAITPSPTRRAALVTALRTGRLTVPPHVLTAASQALTASHSQTSVNPDLLQAAEGMTTIAAWSAEIGSVASDLGGAAEKLAALAQAAGLVADVCNVLPLVGPALKSVSLAVSGINRLVLAVHADAQMVELRSRLRAIQIRLQASVVAVFASGVQEQQLLDDVWQTAERCSNVVVQIERSLMAGKWKRVCRVQDVPGFVEHVAEMEAEVRRIDVVKFVAGLHSIVMKNAGSIDVIKTKISELERCAIRGDAFRPYFDERDNDVRVHMRWEDPDAPESRLVARVLAVASGRNTGGGAVVAHGRRSGFAAVGGGGVGKTCALRALTKHPSIRGTTGRLFPGGVYFITFGNDATEADCIERMAYLVDRSGGTQRAKKIRACNFVEDAISFTREHFAKEKSLLLCDDIWPLQGQTGKSPGYYLGQVLDYAAGSCLVISTRDDNIARMSSGENQVPFEAVDPEGKVARRILAAHADHTLDDVEKLEGSEKQGFEEVLRMCSGHQLGLALAGAAVRARMRRPVLCVVGLWTDQSTAMRKQGHGWAAAARHLPDDYPRGLYETLLATVDCLAAARRGGWQTSDSDSRLYERVWSLCVMRKQISVPLSMMMRLWHLRDESECREFACELEEISLVTLHTKIMKTGRKEVMLSMHDLVLDFCAHFADMRLQGGVQGCHARLMDEYHQFYDSDVSEQQTEKNKAAEQAEQDPTRSWVSWFQSAVWSFSPSSLLYRRKLEEQASIIATPWPCLVKEDEYFMRNAVYHLLGAKYNDVLEAILLHHQWISAQLCAETGAGAVALLQDYDLSLSSTMVLKDENAVRFVRGALLDGWHSFSSPRVTVQLAEYEMSQRLSAILPADNAGVLAYLGSQKTNKAVKPYLRPYFDELPAPQLALYARRACEVGSRVWHLCEHAGDGHILVLGTTGGTHATTKSLLSQEHFDDTGDDVVINFRGGCSSTDGVFRVLCGLGQGFYGLEWRIYCWKSLQLTASHVVCAVRDADEFCYAGMNSTGTVVAVCERHSSAVYVWRIGDSQPPICIECDAGNIQGLHFAPWSDDVFIVVGSPGTVSAICVTNPNDPFILASSHLDLAGDIAWCCAVSGQGEEGARARIAVGTRGAKICLVDGLTLCRTGVLKTDGDCMSAVQFSSDGSRLISGHDDGSVRVLSAASGDLVAGPFRHGTVVLSVCLAQDERILWSGGSDGLVCSFDATFRDTFGPGAKADSPHDGFTVKELAMSADKTTAASMDRAGRVHIWDVVRRCRRTSSFIQKSCAKEPEITCIALTNDGNRLLTGCNDGRLRLVASTTGSLEVLSSSSHGGTVSVVCISADGTCAMSICEGKGTAHTWDLESLTLLEQWVYSASASSHQLHAAAACAPQTAHRSFPHERFPKFSMNEASGQIVQVQLREGDEVIELAGIPDQVWSDRCLQFDDERQTLWVATNRGVVRWYHFVSKGH